MDERSISPATRHLLSGVYNERNRLVAALTSLLPSSLEWHEGADWEDEWRWVVVIDLGEDRQAAWHIHISELPLFWHVPRLRGRAVDARTTAENYAMLEQFVAGRAKEARREVLDQIASNVLTMKAGRDPHGEWT